MWFCRVWKGEGGGKIGENSTLGFGAEIGARTSFISTRYWTERPCLLHCPTEFHFRINTTLCSWLHLHTTRTKRDRSTRPFPARPCRCSRNSGVGLSGKQTVRGCWESSAGLQIIVGLTKVSEPAPLLPHTYMHCVHTPTRARSVAHIKGAIEANVDGAYTIGF